MARKWYCWMLAVGLILPWWLSQGAGTVLADVSDEAYNQLLERYRELVAAFEDLGAQQRQMMGRVRTLESENEKLREHMLAQQELLQRAQQQILSIQEQVREERRSSRYPPYTVISERKVQMYWRDPAGTLRSWEVPIDAYRAEVVRVKPLKKLELKGRGGERFQVLDFRPFIDPTPFTGVVNEMYRRAGSDERFVREVWYTVSQITTYSSDIAETPRWPLETLVENGGDCEDTAILTASLIAAAPADFKVELVYFDAQNPKVARAVNHVAVQVTLPDGKGLLIETTSKDRMTPYETVDGWYLAAVQ